jgi:hypothetical protein
MYGGKQPVHGRCGEEKKNFAVVAADCQQNGFAVVAAD